MNVDLLDVYGYSCTVNVVFDQIVYSLHISNCLCVYLIYGPYILWKM